MINICFAGVTGWAAPPILAAIDEADDLTLTAMAARHLGHWEIIDYASDTKPDVPSGTARELAETLAQVREAGPGERLTMRHDPGLTPAPYVAGTLLAVRNVADAVGVRRGLDSLLFDGPA